MCLERKFTNFGNVETCLDESRLDLTGHLPMRTLYHEDEGPLDSGHPAYFEL